MSFEYSIEKISKREYARSYNFRVQIQGMPDIHQNMIVSCTTPKATCEEVPGNWTGAAIPIVGKGSFEPVNISVMEDIGGPIYNAFYEWFSDSFHILPGAQMTAKPMQQIVSNRTVTIYQLDGQGRDKFHFKMYKCLLLSTPSTQYTYEGSGIIIYEVQINYFGFEYHQGSG